MSGFCYRKYRKRTRKTILFSKKYSETPFVISKTFRHVLQVASKINNNVKKIKNFETNYCDLIILVWEMHLDRNAKYRMVEKSNRSIFWPTIPYEKTIQMFLQT